MQWIVEYGDDVYGPFPGVAEASAWCDRFQARSSIKIRPLQEPVPGMVGKVFNMPIIEDGTMEPGTFKITQRIK